MTMTKQRIETPWGVSDVRDNVKDGVVFHSTSSHGGYYLPPALRIVVKSRVPEYETFIRGGVWWEEDCDAAVLAATLPEVFGAEKSAEAMEYVRNLSKWDHGRGVKYQYVINALNDCLATA